jgi:hypothetical protein
MTVNENTYMQDVPVNNEELLSILNQYVDLMFRDPNFEKYMHLASSQQKDNRDWWVGEKYMKDIMDQGHRHEGFPDEMYGYECSVHRQGHSFLKDDAPASYKRDVTMQLANLNNQMMQWLGVRHNALTACYPPGGFISWHNNANAAAYNLIFSWSENGNGWFKYVDPSTKDVVTMNDHAGWQCKAAYFGHYGEPENLFYHAAASDCWRITVSFTLDTSDLSGEFREMILDDIKTP